MAFDPPGLLSCRRLQAMHGISFGATHLGTMGSRQCRAKKSGATAQGYLYVAMSAVLAAMLGMSGFLFGAFGAWDIWHGFGRVAGGFCVIAARPQGAGRVHS